MPTLGLPAPTLVKLEPTDGEEPKPADGATEEGPVNIMVPKKKRRIRSPSVDEDLPPPPPPMMTIRIERELPEAGETLTWNVLDDAKEAGMIAEWPVKDLEHGKEVLEKVEDASKPELPAADGDLPPEATEEEKEMHAIAKRLADKYDKPAKRAKKVVSLRTG